jgi:2-polyprenyl-6-methoxyphenol hydroxylase-like FAD-dependent oxidoreductase
MSRYNNTTCFCCRLKPTPSTLKPKHYTNTKATTTTTTKPYDLLIGADGIQSAVRAAMQSADSSMTVEIADSGREYVTYRGLPDAGYAGAASVEPPEFAGNDGATLHLWASDDPFSSFTTHSDPDGTYSGTISLRTGGFESVKTAANFEAFLTSKFTGIPEAWIAPIAAQAAGQTPSPAGKRTKCSTLCSSPRGRAVLIGDAAHSVTPVFGQGANSALESCLVLDKTLAAAAGDVEAAPAAFDAARRADAHALQEVDRLAFSFFRRRGLFDKDFVSLFAHVILGTILSKVVPFLYGPRPALLRLGSKDMPYSQILKAVRRDAAAAAVLVAGAVAWFAWRFFARLAATGGAAA